MFVLLGILPSLTIDSLAISEESGKIPGRFIVVLRPDATPQDVAEEHGLTIGHIYRSALHGFSASGPPEALQELMEDPRVIIVENDRFVRAEVQTLPTGIDRIEADQNIIADIDGSDERVDVDIAIIDTGIDLDHPDLNVFMSIDCTGGGPGSSSCTGTGNDNNGHGSHVAGTAAALDNGIGVVGLAPGARLWAVKVLGAGGSGFLIDIIGGIDWVTLHAPATDCVGGETATHKCIEVVNMSLGFQGQSSAFRLAIQNSVSKGVVYFTSAGNDGEDVYGPDGTFGTNDDFIPQAYPEVAAISAMVDTDGQPGGLGSSTTSGDDDSFASFSNFGLSVVGGNPVSSPGLSIDLILPGRNILSTYKNAGYATISGTSMSSPHAAGLAALYIASTGLLPMNANDVYDIRQALIDRGVAQDDSRGLDSLNDPDSNRENLGWAVGYDLTLNMDTVTLGAEVTATASTDDISIDQVAFTWFEPDGITIGRGPTTDTSSPFEDSFTPDEIGTWTVRAEFEDGMVIEETVNVSFLVVPESPFGSIALVVAAFGSLILLTRRRNKNNIRRPRSAYSSRY